MQELPEIVSSTAYITTSAETGDHRERRIVLGNQTVVGKQVFEKVADGLEKIAAADFNEEDEVMKRLVRVFVVDPDEAIDIDKSLLYDSKEKLTDLDDQELFFEVGIQEILKEHNEYRKTVIDKEVKERTEYLEPVRIRELRMTVVTLAEF